MHSISTKSRKTSLAKQVNRGPSRRTDAAAAPAHGKRAVVFSVVLAIAAIALYYPVTSHPFANYDDDVYVTHNRQVKAGLSWATMTWAATSYDACNWHPLTWLSHALDWQLFGDHASGHHAVNLLLHVLNALLLYWVLLRATGAAGPSFVVAALFALHPINVESVAWVAERKNLLSMFLFLLALGAYSWYARAPRPGRYGVVALLYATALMAKPQVITFPCVLLLWDYWPLRRVAVRPSPFALRQNPSIGGSDEQRMANGEQRPFPWLVLEKLPLLGLSAASAVVTVQAQRASSAIRWFPFAVRAENAIVAYARYVGKALWPTRLALIYPHPEHTLSLWQVMAATLLVAAVTTVVIQQRERRYLLVGWFWFLGTLVPMIGLVQVGGQAMADRYAYLSFIGLFVMLCWGIRDFAAARHVPAKWLAGATAVVLVLLAGVARHQLDYWHDNLTLWGHTLDITQNNWLAENNYGAALLGENRVDEAIEHFRRSATIFPDDPVSHLDIGYYEQQHGNFDGAFAEYATVYRVTPKEKRSIAAEAHNNMGFAYLQLRDPGTAEENFRAAVSLDPYHSRAWIGLGVAQQKNGNLKAAIQDYSRSTRIEASDLAYLLLAQAQELAGDNAAAQGALEQAQRISPNFRQEQQIVSGFLRP